MNLDALLDLARTQLLQVTITIALASIITFLARRRPHIAYAVWIAVLIKAVTPPIWSSPTGVFSWMNTAGSDAAPPRVEQSTATDVDDANGRASARRDLAPSLEVFPTVSTAPSAPMTRHLSPTVKPSISTHPQIDAKHALIATWILGTLIALVIPLARLFFLRRRVLQHAVTTDDTIFARFDRLRETLGMRRPVRLVICDQNIGPAVVGVIRPMVVIPRSLAEGSHSALRGALAHELIHLRRRDHFVALLQWIATALWWFHPLVWWMNRRLGIAREASCDEESIAALDCGPDDYAQMLLDVVRFRRPGRASLFSLGVSPLQINTQRLEHIMSPSTHFHRRTPLLAWLLSTALVVLLLPGAGLALQNDKTENEKPDEATKPAETMHFSGTIIDAETKQPIEGATVTVHRFSYGLNDSNRRLADDTELKTDAAGKFSFDVPPDQQAPEKRLYLELDVRHPKYASIIGHGYGLSLIKKDLTLGNQPWFNKVELRPGEEVTAVLLDPEGKPAANVPITYSSIAGPYDRRFLATGKDRVDDKTTTDAEGRFHFNAIQGAGLTYFWATPGDSAILFHSVRDQRGDIGTFRLEHGISIPGVVLTSDGKPVPNVGVTLESVEKNDVQNDIASRYTSTDADGKFVFKPVSPAAYEVNVSNVIWEEASETRTVVNVPGAFTKQLVVAEYKDYNKFPPVEVKALEDVTVKLQYIDSAGKPRKGHGIFVWGKLGTENYQLNAKPDENGMIEMFIPKGVTDAKINLMTEPYSSLRWKRGEQGELQSKSKADGSDEIELGTLNADVSDLFVVRYEAPTLIVRAVDADGKPVPDYRPSIRYPGEEPTTRNFNFFNGIQGDVGFEKQDDGSWRSQQLLPGVELKVSADAKGYTATPETMTLKEKETREVTIQMKKS